jgi:hypothetical protein
MTSIILSSCLENIAGEEIESKTNETSSSGNCRYVLHDITKTTRASSFNDEKMQSSSTNNNRIKHFYTRLKRRFSITKDYRTHSEDMNGGISMRFSSYKSFSSTIHDPCNEFEWPDFEKIYDTIPLCLVKALPGLDDLSLEENDDRTDTHTEEIDDQLDLFKSCQRGKSFRRNAVCHKLDKSQYNGQLDTFIQQLMIEKLMRTWT